MRYLQHHQKAKDTLAGIVQWWLLTYWVEKKGAEVERAVSLLVSKRLIIETQRKGSLPYYSINRRKQHAISEILKNEKGTI